MTVPAEAQQRAAETRAIAHRAVTEGVDLRYVEKLRQAAYKAADEIDALVERVEAAEQEANFQRARAVGVMANLAVMEAARVAAEKQVELLTKALRKIADVPDGPGWTSASAQRMIQARARAALSGTAEEENQ